MNNNLPIVWDRKAKQELDNITFYLRNKVSLQTANYVRKGILDHIDKINTFPSKSPLDPILYEGGKEIRFTIKWNYKITFEINDNYIIIIRIMHTKQNPIS